nr:uncharacterized protein LOC106681795 isoform X2 [Halyomorpha halys]
MRRSPEVIYVRMAGSESSSESSEDEEATHKTLGAKIIKEKKTIIPNISNDANQETETSKTTNLGTSTGIMSEEKTNITEIPKRRSRKHANRTRNFRRDEDTTGVVRYTEIVEGEGTINFDISAGDDANQGTLTSDTNAEIIDLEGAIIFDISAGDTTSAVTKTETMEGEGPTISMDGSDNDQGINSNTTIIDKSEEDKILKHSDVEEIEFISPPEDNTTDITNEIGCGVGVCDTTSTGINADIMEGEIIFNISIGESNNDANQGTPPSDPNADTMEGEGPILSEFPARAIQDTLTGHTPIRPIDNATTTTTPAYAQTTKTSNYEITEVWINNRLRRCRIGRRMKS